jgi:hypothetical protein
MDDLKSRLDEIDHARRQLGQSVDASGIVLGRALRYTEQAESGESWPRATRPRRRLYPGAAVALLVAVGVLLGAVIALRLQTAHTPRSAIVVKPAVSQAPIAAAPPATASEPFLIRISATRRCLVRVVVDGNALDWRELKEGDELVSRPAHQMVIESKDPEALAATVNGKSVRVADLNSLFQNRK